LTVTEQIIAKVQALPPEDQQRLLHFLSALELHGEEITPTADSAKTAPAQPAIWSKLAALGNAAECRPTDLPTDLAANHDFYLHGLPKRV
jgi:hypothetical protein